MGLDFDFIRKAITNGKSRLDKRERMFERYEGEKEKEKERENIDT